MLFAQLSVANYNIVENECVEFLLHCLLDSYDQPVINITNYNIGGYLHFEDVAWAILEKESKQKNIVDIVESSRQVEALVMTKGRSTKYGSSGSQTH